MIEFWIILIIKTLVVFGVSMLIVAYSTWIERKVLGLVQLRHGPMRVGWHGLLQPLADGVKGFMKEEVIPDNADKPIFIIAPIISIGAALSLLVIIPFGDTVTIMGREITLYLTDLDIGILYVLGISTIGSYGCMLGGWSSGNKYGMIGALRAGAQMISYEPFDMPEAEAELACGFNVEYSSMKFALFFMAEYCHMFVFGTMVTTLFLGGWHGPLLPGPVWFFIKTFAVVFFCVWERSTFPRYRYDQVMELGWKVLMPAGLLNIVLTGLWMVIFNI